MIKYYLKRLLFFTILICLIGFIATIYKLETTALMTGVIIGMITMIIDELLIKLGVL